MKISFTIGLQLLLMVSIKSQSLSISELHDELYASQGLSQIEVFLAKRNFFFTKSELRFGYIYLLIFEKKDNLGYLIESLRISYEENGNNEITVLTIDYLLNQDHFYKLKESLAQYSFIKKFESKIDKNGLLYSSYVDETERDLYTFLQGEYNLVKIHQVTLSKLSYTEYKKYLEFKTSKSKN